MMIPSRFRILVNTFIVFMVLQTMTPPAAAGNVHRKFMRQGNSSEDDVVADIGTVEAGGRQAGPSETYVRPFADMSAVERQRFLGAEDPAEYPLDALRKNGVISETPTYGDISETDIPMSFPAGIDNISNDVGSVAAAPPARAADDIGSPIDLSETSSRTTFSGLGGPLYMTLANGNSAVLTPIRDQGGLESCWAHSSSTALADRYRLKDPKKYGNLELSSQIMLSCEGDASRVGGTYHRCAIGKAWVFLKGHGTTEEHCLPYQWKTQPDQLAVDPCPAWFTSPAQCPKGCTHSFTATKIYRVRTAGSMQKEIMKNGPIDCSFKLYKSFFTYHDSGNAANGDVYSTSKNEELEGWHNVRVVGWGEKTVPCPNPTKTNCKEKYWLVANSWGVNYGDKGYFRIQRGSNTAMIENECWAGIPA